MDFRTILENSLQNPSFSYSQQGFECYENSLDSKYCELIDKNNVGEFLRKALPEDTFPFYACIFSVISAFLSGKDRVLFIRIPTDELGITDKEQSANFSNIIAVVSHLFMLTLSSILRNRLSLPADIKDAPENQYSIFIPAQIEKRVSWHNEYRFWNIVSDEEEGKRLIECCFPECDHRVHFKKTERKNITSQYWRSALRLADIVDEQLTKGERTKLVNHMLYLNDLLKIGNICSFPQFNRILISTTNKYFPKLGFDLTRPEVSDLFLTGKITDYQNKLDVIAFIGDMSYSHTDDDVLNRLRSDGDDMINKVIYIGTKKPDFAESDIGFMEYSFSYREIYRFFNEGELPSIVEVPINDEYLRQDYSDLVGILGTDEELVEESKRKIASKVIWPFLQYELVKIDNISDWVEDLMSTEYEYACNYDTIDSVIEWAKKASARDFSIKKQVVDEITKRYLKKNNVLVVPKNSRSFKNLIKNFVHKSGKKGTVFILDGLTSIGDDVVMQLYRNCANGTIFLLYYEGFESGFVKSIRRFFSAEEKVYTNSLREKLFDVKWQPDQSICQKNWDISSIELDETVFADLTRARWTAPLDYEVYFDNGSISLDGDVIVLYPHQSPKKISIDDVYEAGGDGVRIVYYKKPDLFSDIISLYKQANGQDPEHGEEYYAQLWQDALKKLFTESFKKDKKTFQKAIKESGISVDLYRYTRNTSSLFLNSPSDMKRTCNLLYKSNLIEKAQIDLILKAQKSNGQNVGFGQQLKKELFDYYLSNNMQRKGILATLSSLNVDIDELKEQSLFEGVIKTINIRNNE